MSKEKNVESLGQAISVLIQGVDLGREKGIYDWNDLETISKAMQFIKSMNDEMSSNQETPIINETPENK